MRARDQIENSTSRRYPDYANFALVMILLVFGILWFAAFLTGKLPVLVRALHPYLPPWLSLTNFLLIPVTCGLAGSRLVGFKTNFFFILVFVAQWSLLTLSPADHPTLKTLMIVFIYFESFLLLPRWNRRILETQNVPNELGLRQ